MKKKIMGLMLVALSAFLLVACGKETMDGKYYEYWVSSNTNEPTLNDDPMIIDGISVSGASGFEYDLTLDEEKRIFISVNNREFPYVYDNGILVFNGDTYYKEGSQAYKDKLAEIGKTEK